MLLKAPGGSKHVANLQGIWGCYQDARRNTEAMAFRGHRLLDQVRSGQQEGCRALPAWCAVHATDSATSGGVLHAMYLKCASGRESQIGVFMCVRDRLAHPSTSLHPCLPCVPWSGVH